MVDDLHHRLVRLAKVLLPAATLVLIGFLVAWPRFHSGETSFMLSYSDISNYDDRIRMVRPRYEGTDKKNRPFVITADAAVQDRPGAEEVTLQGLNADITLSDGTWLSVEAATGIFRPGDEILKGADGVGIFSDLGYELHAEEAEIDVGLSRASGNHPVSLRGPMGKFKANRFAADLEARSVTFENAVKATIYPRPGK
ncbi:MAG: hypothetical protein ACE5EM_01515 [Sphingomonadales bacterium]